MELLFTADILVSVEDSDTSGIDRTAFDFFCVLDRTTAGTASPFRPKSKFSEIVYDSIKPCLDKSKKTNFRLANDGSPSPMLKIPLETKKKTTIRLQRCSLSLRSHFIFRLFQFTI